MQEQLNGADQAAELGAAEARRAELAGMGTDQINGRILEIIGQMHNDEYDLLTRIDADDAMHDYYEWKRSGLLREQAELVAERERRGGRQ